MIDPPTSEDALVVEARGAVRTIVFNRPDQRNALQPAAWLRLRDILDEIAADRAARVVVLRGAGGRAFSSGYDIGALQQLDEQGVILSTPDDPFEVALAALVAHPLPTIAMISGFAVGGGCTIAVGCDLRIAGASSRLGMPPAKLGLLYSQTELAPFVDLLGPSRTKWLFYSGRIIDAQRALQIGLIDDLVPDDELEAYTSALAEEIAGNAPLSVQGTKLVLREMRGAAATDEAAARIAVEIRRVNTSADLAEGKRAFFEKRRPQFQGD